MASARFLRHLPGPVNAVPIAIHRMCGGHVRGRLRALRLRCDAADEPSTAASTTSVGNGSTGQAATVSFALEHHVDFGDSVCLVGDDPVLGSWSVDGSVSMTWSEGDVWTTELTIPAGNTVEYKYIVRHADGTVVEWLPGDNKVAAIPSDGETLDVKDIWEDDIEAAADAEEEAAEAEGKMVSEGATEDGDRETLEKAKGVVAPVSEASAPPDVKEKAEEVVEDEDASVRRSETPKRVLARKEGKEQSVKVV